MATELRLPSLNERRCIIRHELDFYRGLATAAVYTTDWPQPPNSRSCFRLFGPALQKCVEQHPILGTVIDEPASEEARFRRLPELQLKQHIHFVSHPNAIRNALVDQTESDQTHLRKPEDEQIKQHVNSLADLKQNASDAQGASVSHQRELLRKVLEQAVNLPFPDVRETPPWRIFILPIPEQDPIDGKGSPFLVVYNYSHSHGDGLSGLIFHRCLRRALSRNSPSNAEQLTIPTGSRALPSPPEPWPISWPFFLGVLAKELVPWLPRLLFWRQVQPAPALTESSVFYDKETFRAGIRLISIDDDSVKLALKRCKARQIKLTGLLHLLIVRGLAAALRARDIDPMGFASSTPIDLRRAFGLPSSGMNNAATAVSRTFAPPQSSEAISEAELQSARELAAELARSSSTTQDQVLGLLKYAVPIGPWLKGKVGKARGDTYELSNAMSFDPDEGGEDGVDDLDRRRVKIDSICWTQPADVVGQALSVNVVSLKGGDLSIAMCWQYGALGIAKPGSDATADAEDAFMNDLSSVFEEEFAKWANSSTD